MLQNGAVENPADTTAIVPVSLPSGVNPEDTDPKEPKKSKGRSSDDAVRRRHKEILNILDEFERQGLVADYQMIRKELWNRGYYIQERTMYYDMLEIDRLNEYVSDIAKARYARIIEYCYENLEKIIRRSDEIYRMQWSNSKRVTKETVSDGDEGNKLTREEHNTVEIAGPKIKALDINIKAIKVILDSINGRGLISVGANLLHAQFMEINEIKNKLEEELKVKSAELDELKRERTIAKKTSTGV